jgi:hypothetical protein
VSLNYCHALNSPLLPPDACNVQGGFSEVQLAQDRLTGKAVALKIIFLNRPGLTADQVTVRADWAAGCMQQHEQHEHNCSAKHALQQSC